MAKKGDEDAIEVIDGSHGEGGGQIIRTSVSISALTRTPVRVVNIRANRPNPGLRAQHLEGIRALSKICNAKVEGLKVGSPEVTFRPGDIDGGRHTVNIGTAGSIPLLIHTVLLPSLWAHKETFLRIYGGTDVKWSPSIEYTHFVQLSMLRLMGTKANLALMNRGYFPKGGGEVEIRIHPVAEDGLKPLVLLDQDGEPKIFGSVHTAGLPDHVGKRIGSTVRKSLVGFKSIKIMNNSWDTLSPGAGITLVAEFGNTLLGACAVGEKGKRAEIVAKEAVDDIKAEGRSGATVDVHLADQILPFMAVATGPSEFLVRDVSEHTSTNMWLIEKLLGTRFKVEDNGELKRITVEPTKPIPKPKDVD